MKFKSSYVTSLALCATLGMSALCPHADSQQTQASGGTEPAHYKIVFPGTFGGPNSHFAIFGTHILNNDGSFVGWADDSLPDPFAPDACWDGDCFVARSFHFKNGVMTDLGSLAPGLSSDVSWMSPSGLISGESQNGETFGPAWLMHGVLWAHGKMIDLGTLDGGPISLATSVNDSAEVVGFALNTIPDPISMFAVFQTRAYRWKDGVMQDLGTLGGPDAMAMRINERGQISGNSYLSENPSDACANTGNPGIETGAFLWEQGKMTDLGGFGGSCTRMNDMNNRGQVVGFSFLPKDTAQHAFLWQRGKLIDLGTLGGNIAAAQSINEAGDVVGAQTLPGNDLASHAALWTGGRIFDLGALGPDQCSFASSVNSQLQVVGLNSSDCQFDEPSLRAIISERGGPVVDLNTLIPANSGVELRNASIINERGEIVAVAFYQNGNHGPVLLVPCESESNSVISDSCQNVGSPPLAKTSAQTTAKPYLGTSPWMHYTTAGLWPQRKAFGSALWVPKKR